MIKSNPLANRKKKQIIENVGTVTAYAEHEKYEYIVDYNLLDTSPEENKKLMEYEEQIGRSAKKIGNELLLMGEFLYKGQELLANHSGGTFEKWYTAMGFKKTWVYMQIKRYSLSVRYEKKEFGKLPEKIINTISKEQDKLTIDDIEEVIVSKKPATILEMKLESFGDRTTENEIIEIIEKEDTIDEVLKRLDKEIKYHQEVLKELQAKRIKVLKEIENKNNEIFRKYLNK